MKFSFQRFFLVATTVMGTVSVAAEPCANGYGAYDMTTCNECAKNGKGKGQCCNAIYRNSLGRDDDFLKEDVSDDCALLGKYCDVGQDGCVPGLTCTHGCKGFGMSCETHPNPPCPSWDGGGFDIAIQSLPPIDFGDHATRNADDGGGPSFVVVVVGLLGAALMVRKVVTSRHRDVALRRHQYSEVDATTTTTPLSV